MITPKSFLPRLISFPFIRPILNDKWHEPKDVVKGAENAQQLPLISKYDSEIFASGRDYAIENKSSAFLVMHKGELVFEEYFGGFKPEQYFNSMSLMKTVLALLIGIAVDEGDIDSVDTPASEFITEWQNDSRKGITIKHLLTMQSGLMSDVALGKYFNRIIPLYLGDDAQKYAIECPAYSQPGDKLIYNNVNSQVLGILLERATQRRYADYLSEKLWQPLGCYDAEVWIDDKGLARTFSSLFARPQDWMRVGQLVLNGGQHDGQQFVPEQWVKDMCQGHDKNQRYGYQIWTKAHVFDSCAGFPQFEYYESSKPFDDADTVFFEGMKEQLLVLVPSKELLVFRMGEAPKRDWDSVTLVHRVSRNII